MLGSKLRSWMEAVRPRKKQQRKEKQVKSILTNPNGMMVSNSQSLHSNRLSETEMLEDVNRKSMNTVASHAPRYSGANLSSPESAYSTGYSTDGTSPGAPPEYYINIRTGTRYFPSTGPDSEKYQSPLSNHAVYSNNISSSYSVSSKRGNQPPLEHNVSTVAVHLNGDQASVSMVKTFSQEHDNHKNSSSRTSVTLHNNNLHPSNGVASRMTEIVVNSGVTSPRQRNRIRTNPWVPGNNLSPGNSCIGLHIRQDATKPSIMAPTKYPSPVLRSPINRISTRESLSSSSCSSLSAASVNWDPGLVQRSPRINSGTDDEEEEDCTLNEMMGKYDESYVYEKETDILSDSDPTDCETDIDTGQDGGDEDEPFELDFIDNGSYSEFNSDKDARNTGHCTYYNYEVQRRVSRRRNTRKSQKQEQHPSKQLSERRRRSTSSKRKHKLIGSKQQAAQCQQIDGSRSAGATPLSVRRTRHPVSKLAIEEHLKRRSNSVSFSSVNAIDQRDKEADKKYKELIVEAEHILMSMKTNGLSPRRLPGPPNKRVELLRNAESTKPDAFIRNRLTEDVTNLQLSRIPSSNFNSPRFSPKKNHITNFINNNSPVLMRKEIEVRSPRKELQSCLKQPPSSPLTRNKITKTEPTKASTKYRKKLNKNSSLKSNRNGNFSSDSDDDELKPARVDFAEYSCPQSEPVKRKVYNNQSKTVAFNLNYENVCNPGRLETSVSSLSLKKRISFSEIPSNGVADENRNSSENLRQQVLLNTIASLKRSLEDQSASLRQVYRSSQNVNM